MKNKRFISVLFLTSLLLQAEEAETKDLTVEASVGVAWVGYEENVSIVPVRSDWEAPAGSGRISAVVTRYPVDLYGSIRWVGSATDTEEWREGRFLVQENDLTYAGGDLRFGLRFPVVESASFQLIPRVGGAVRLDVFERENFLFFRDEGTLFSLDQEVTESVVTAGPTAGIRLWKTLGEKMALQVDSEFFWPSYSEADNDGFQVTIDGDGGFTWSAEATLFFDLVQPHNQMGASIGVLVQELNGDTVVEDGRIYEWPDSTLEVVTFELFWIARF